METLMILSVPDCYIQHPVFSYGLVRLIMPMPASKLPRLSRLIMSIALPISGGLMGAMVTTTVKC